MSDLREAAQSLLNAWDTGDYGVPLCDRMESLRAALAAPQPEPVAYLCPGGCGCTWRDNRDGSMSLLGRNSQSCGVCEPLPLSKLIPLYAHPQRSYTPMTDEEIADVARQPVNDLLDHIYEYGTIAEGVTGKVSRITRAIERAVLERLGVELEKRDDN